MWFRQSKFLSFGQFLISFQPKISKNNENNNKTRRFGLFQNFWKFWLLWFWFLWKFWVLKTQKIFRHQKTRKSERLGNQNSSKFFPNTLPYILLKYYIYYIVFYSSILLLQLTIPSVILLSSLYPEVKNKTKYGTLEIVLS